MIPRNTKVFAELRNYGQLVDLHLAADDYDSDARHIVQPVTIVKVDRDDEGAIHPPAMTMKHTTAQLLVDELWRIGFRPTEGTGSAGSLAATERHLKDMQAIAVGLLRKDGVELKP